MELGNVLWLILAVAVGSYAVLFGFLSNINECYYVRVKLGLKRSRLLSPGDMGWPFIGNMISFFKAFRSEDPDSFIHNLVQRYGCTRIYKTCLFGNASIIVCSPEACKQVLMDEENFGQGWPKSVSKLFGKLAFINTSDAGHKHLRRQTTRPIRSHDALAKYVGFIENNAINRLNEWSERDKPIEFFSEMKKFAFSVITHIFLGVVNDSVSGPVEKHYTNLLLGFVSSPINFPGFAFYKALKARKALVRIIRAALNDKKANKERYQREGKSGIVDLMLDMEYIDGEKLEDERIIDLLLTFLLAGHETSARSIMWTIIYLNQHPEIMQKAREEQEKIIKRRPSTQEGLSIKEVKQMEYLAKVIDEVLRRTNVAALVFRQAKEDVNINGYLIPKGWKVLVWSRAVHMDPEIYPNPKEFDPSRWEKHVTKPGAFTPFGLGPRICPGSDLAKLEISIFLHYFLLNYKLERLNPDCPSVYVPGPMPSDKCLANVIKLS